MAHLVLPSGNNFVGRSWNYLIILIKNLRVRKGAAEGFLFYPCYWCGLIITSNRVLLLWASALSHGILILDLFDRLRVPFSCHRQWLSSLPGRRGYLQYLH